MNEIEITICGNVCSDVLRRSVGGGREVTSFRVATSARHFRDGQWSDGPTTYVAVQCFGALGRNAIASIHRGEPVIVRGRMRVRTWEHEGVTRTSVDVEATSVGHDLVLGTATFSRSTRAVDQVDPWSGVDPALAASAREAGLSPDRATADLERAVA